MPNPNNRSRHNDPSKKFGQSGNRAGKGNFSKPGGRPQRDDRPSPGGFDKSEGGFNRGTGDKFEKREGGFNRGTGGKFEKREGGFNRGTGGKFEKREGGFNRGAGGKFEKREGGFNRGTGGRFEKREGGFNRGTGGKFEKREGGFNRGTGGKFEKREGGFNRGIGDQFNRSAHTDRDKRDQRYGARNIESNDSTNTNVENTGSDRTSKRAFTPALKNDGTAHRPRQKASKKDHDQDGFIRLNRYIANSGICSRRKADELIEAGVVSVNGVVVSELGTKVDPAIDEIRYNGERLRREKMVYILLNKPKDYITTTDDPQERKTVMHLIAKATRERVYPIGRLDRNTTGLLLLTNDGNLSEKLSHPRNLIAKIYHVELNKSLTQGDFNKIEFGLELEDGFVKPDEVSFVMGASKKEIGIKIHSGKNRIVRRIFEHLGYEVVKLDRVVYANLTKKDLPRGNWRYLEEKEIVQLKHLV